MPNDQSKEKINLLKQLGAEVVLTEKAPFTDPKNYIQLSKKIAEEKNANWANQFDNLANRKAHLETTANEIWQQTQGKDRRLYLFHRNWWHFSGKLFRASIKIKI